MSSAISSQTRAYSDAELPAAPSQAVLALVDLIEGFGKSWLWTALAMQDLRLRYRGSVLGPLWLTISTVVMIGTMGLLYPHLFHTSISTYLPFLTLGLILWGFISSLINDGCTCFLAVNNIIQQVRLPFSVHVYRMVYRDFLVMLHSLVIVPVVLLIFPHPIGWSVLSVVPAMAVLLVDGVWIAFLLGMMSARYRDIPPVVASFIQVVFFVTPIFWSPELLGRWEILAELNPLFAAVDVVRAPLLGLPVAPWSWPVLLVDTALGCGLSFLVFARFRRRIAFWV